jgi:hypothetical protein
VFAERRPRLPRRTMVMMMLRTMMSKRSLHGTLGRAMAWIHEVFFQMASVYNLEAFRAS